MQYRDSKGKYARKPSWLAFLITILIVSGVSFSIPAWLSIREANQPTEVLSPVVEEEISEWDKFIATLDPVERVICEAFPVDQCKIALAVTLSENGARNPEALHANLDGSFDVGIMQINSRHWNTDYCPGLHELTTVEANVQCGLEVWDRRDGTPDDGQGSWAAWSDFNNGKFANNL